MATLELTVLDWSGSSRADLSDVPSDITVGELLAEVKGTMGLPARTPYGLVRNGHKVARGLTLDEAGIASGEEVTIAPEVSAG